MFGIDVTPYDKKYGKKSFATFSPTKYLTRICIFGSPALEKSDKKGA